MKNTTWQVWQNQVGGIEVVAESEVYRFGFFSQKLADGFDTREDAEDWCEGNVPDEWDDEQA